MKTAQKELIAKRQEIEEKLQTILYEDEKLELLYCGRQYASAYALIRRKDGMYYKLPLQRPQNHALLLKQDLRHIRADHERSPKKYTRNPRQSLMVSLHPIRLPHPAHHLLFQ